MRAAMRSLRRICSTARSLPWNWRWPNGWGNSVFLASTTVRKIPLYIVSVRKIHPAAWFGFLLIRWLAQPQKKNVFLWSHNVTRWGFCLLRLSGASEWCWRRSYWWATHGFLSLLFHNSHHCFPGAHYISSHATALFESSHAPHGKNTSGGRRGVVNLIFKNQNLFLCLYSILIHTPCSVP